MDNIISYWPDRSPSLAPASVRPSFPRLVPSRAAWSPSSPPTDRPTDRSLGLGRDFRVISIVGRRIMLRINSNKPWRLWRVAVGGRGTGLPAGERGSGRGHGDCRCRTRTPPAPRPLIDPKQIRSASRYWIYRVSFWMLMIFVEKWWAKVERLWAIVWSSDGWYIRRPGLFALDKRTDFKMTNIVRAWWEKCPHSRIIEIIVHIGPCVLVDSQRHLRRKLIRGRLKIYVTFCTRSP